MRRFEPIIASERGDYEVQTSKSKNEPTIRIDVTW
jgi:hypothetical protein